MNSEKKVSIEITESGWTISATVKGKTVKQIWKNDGGYAEQTNSVDFEGAPFSESLTDALESLNCFEISDGLRDS